MPLTGLHTDWGYGFYLNAKESAAGDHENHCGRSYSHCFGKNYV
jgi:hypothetical protein